MRYVPLFLLAGSMMLVGCAWVKPSLESQQVVYQPLEAVGQCRKVGLAQVKTLSKVAFVPRSEEVIRNELISLAKNEAVIMKGDTVAPNGAVRDGAQEFGVYRCR